MREEVFRRFTMAFDPPGWAACDVEARHDLRHDGQMRIGMRLAVGLLSSVLAVVLFSASVQAAPTLTVDELEALSLRSPNVLDTYFAYQHVYETRLPRVFFEGEALVGPGYEISVDGVATPVQIAGGQISAGTVPWVWGPQSGIRFGADMYSTNLTPKGEAMADGWGYRSVLFYGAVFDRTMPWSVTVGAYLTMRPVTAFVDGERVFSRTHPQAKTSSAGSFEYTTDDRSKTTEVESVQAFVHGTVPWIGLTTAVLIDAEGIRKAKGNVNVRRSELWKSLGPQFGAIRELAIYQLGFHALDFRGWELPVTVSTESDMRYEEGEGLAFDYAVVKMAFTFFEDKRDREQSFRSKDFETDFHLRLELRGSYYNVKEIRQPWGGGAFLDALSIGLDKVELRFGVGGGYNYYEDIVKLPISDVANFQFILGLGV